MIAPWPPTRYCTPPLREDFESAIDSVLPVLEYVWRKSFGYWLEDWQVDLCRHILELDNGCLRHRQVVVSVGRQNGKTEIAAVLGLWRLLWRPNALVIGIASSADQARIVYDRTMQAIDKSGLHKYFKKLTETRGIQTNDGSKYEIKAAKGAALQGLPIDLGIIDEIHLLKQELWTSLVNGTGGRNDCLVIGITTAGDENSTLLKHLYDLGTKGEVGFFCWEAPLDADMATSLKAANPSIASGRIPLSNAMADARSLPEHDLVRYRYNRFTASQAVFLPLGLWQACAGGQFPEGKVVFAIDRTPDWGYASIVAAVKADKVHTELVASIVKPTLDELATLCSQLAPKAQTFVVDSYMLRDLGNELKKRGYPVEFSSQADLINASSMLYAKIKQGKLSHANDPLLSLQIPRAVRKNIGDGFRISRNDSSIEIDAVMATTMAVYFAETYKDVGIQLF